MTSVNKNAISPFQLEIRATARSWVQVKEDGKVLYDGVLTTGTSKHFTSGSALDVKLGYAGAVQLSFNGKPLPSFEPGTKEKILRFTPNGLAQSR